MTLEEITERIENIRAKANEDDEAHKLQDKLYEDFIAWIAASEFECSPLAQLVLRAKDIEFSRWYS